MKTNTQGKNLDTLNAGIAKSREEIAALAAGLKNLAEWKIDNPPVAAQKRPSNGDGRHGGWTDFKFRLDQAGARGESIAKGLADEIVRHPLIGGMAAFGVGFMFAKLLFKRKKRIPEDEMANGA